MTTISRTRLVHLYAPDSMVIASLLHLLSLIFAAFFSPKPNSKTLTLHPESSCRRSVGGFGVAGDAVLAGGGRRGFPEPLGHKDHAFRIRVKDFCWALIKVHICKLRALEEAVPH